MNETSGHEPQMKTCKRKKSLKRKKDPEPLSEATTHEEIENIDSGSADDISFSLDKDVSDIENESDKEAPPEVAIPVTTEYSTGKYFVVFYTEPNMLYFWGEVTKTFDNDDNGPVKKVETDCLQKKKKFSNPKKLTWVGRNRNKDVDIVEIDYIFYGPEEPVVRKGVHKFPDEMATARLKIIENYLKK